MCDWVTLPCSRKLTQHGKPAIVEKMKIIIKKKKTSFQISPPPKKNQNKRSMHCDHMRFIPGAQR